jgi:hypothetical protein
MTFGCAMEDWLSTQITVAGIPCQNWMVVTFALISVAVLINLAERMTRP